MVINVAIVGAGYWGTNLLKDFSLISNAHLHTCCDADQNKLINVKKRYPWINIVNDYNLILKNKEIDAVVIATPVATHYHLAKLALESGKHVFVEKPMTDSIETSMDLINIANKNNKLLMVDHTFEYMPAINKVKEIIDSGDLGKIYYAHAQWLNLGLLQPDVNVVWDLAPHIFSIFNYLFNANPISVSASSGCYVKKGFENEIAEIANLSINFSEGIKLFITLSWLEPCKIRKFTIVGNKKMLVFDMLNSAEQVKIYDKSVNLINDENKIRVSYRAGEVLSPVVENKEALSICCAHFIDCITNNKEPISSGKSGLNIVKLLKAIDDSIKNGGAEISLQ